MQFFTLIFLSMIAGYLILVYMTDVDVSAIQMSDVTHILGDFCDTTLQIGGALWESIAELSHSISGKDSGSGKEISITCDDISRMTQNKFFIYPVISSYITLQ